MTRQITIKNKQRKGRRAAPSNGDSVGKYMGDAWSLAKRTAVGLNEIRKLINVEQKFIDLNYTTAPDQTGVVTYLTPVPQGDDIAQREGNSIKIQRFVMNSMVIFNPLSAGPQFIRILVCRDLQNQGALPLAGDVLETLGIAAAPLQQLDFINQQNSRFTVVADELLALDQYNPSAVVRLESVHDCHVIFRGSTNAVTSAGNGAYFAVMVSGNATNLPTVISNSRLYFTDN